MNVRAAKVGVWFYMLFTLASFATTVIFYITTTGMGTIAIAGLPLWMAYTVFSLIKSIADLIGRQQRVVNLPECWTGGRTPLRAEQGLLLLFFMTMAVGAIKLAVPVILVQF